MGEATALERIGPFLLREQTGDTSFHDAVDERDGTEALVFIDAGRSFAERVLAAKRLWSSVGHPAFARLLDAGEDARGVYFATEKLGGQTLYDLVRSGPADASEAVEIARQLLSAAAALHAQGHLLTHDGGDIRVSFVDDRPRVRLDTTLFPRPVGHAPGVCGKAQLEGPDVAGPLDERSDVWRVGALLYYMLCGAMPFDGCTQREVWDAICKAPPAPFDLDVPSGLRQVVWRALEKRPQDRHAGVADFLAALAGF